MNQLYSAFIPLATPLAFFYQFLYRGGTRGTLRKADCRTGAESTGLLDQSLYSQFGRDPVLYLANSSMELIPLTGKNGAALRAAAKTNQKTLEQRIDGLEEQQQILFILVGLVTALTLLT